MIPSAKEVEHARELLSRYFRPTRLASAESLAQRSGARVYLKIESDLPTGSFKPRGALNALLTTAAQRPVPGVVAASTGNHGAAVAYAARIAKVGVTIFLPENPNPVKRARIVALGAKVVERGTMGGSAASEGAAEFAREHGHYFLDDASDPLETNVIAIRELVDEVRLVSEQELLDAIRILLLDEHVVAEASGAAATAAFLQDPSDYADAEIVLLVTGANVSPEVLRRAVT